MKVPNKAYSNHLNETLTDECVWDWKSQCPEVSASKTTPQSNNGLSGTHSLWLLWLPTVLHPITQPSPHHGRLRSAHLGALLSVLGRNMSVHQRWEHPHHRQVCIMMTATETVCRKVGTPQVTERCLYLQKLYFKQSQSRAGGGGGGDFKGLRLRKSKDLVTSEKLLR